MGTLVSESQPTTPTFAVGRWLAIIGSFCLFAPLLGVSITVVSLVRRFGEMSQSTPFNDPATLSRSVGDALVTTGIGFGISTLGICLVCVAIFAFRFRPSWLWSTLIAASLLWLFAFPVGTILAVIAIDILVRNRHAFVARDGQAVKGILA